MRNNLFFLCMRCLASIYKSESTTPIQLSSSISGNVYNDMGFHNYISRWFGSHIYKRCDTYDAQYLDLGAACIVIDPRLGATELLIDANNFVTKMVVVDSLSPFIPKRWLVLSKVILLTTCWTIRHWQMLFYVHNISWLEPRSIARRWICSN